MNVFFPSYKMSTQAVVFLSSRTAPELTTSILFETKKYFLKSSQLKSYEIQQCLSISRLFCSSKSCQPQRFFKLFHNLYRSEILNRFESFKFFPNFKFYLKLQTSLTSEDQTR